MQQQDELGPEADGKTRDPNFEIRNKSECQKFKCSKRCRKSSRLTGILEDKLFLVILIFKLINDESVISALFKVAGYTYGPLLGMYAFGLFTKWKIKDHLIIPVVLLAPTLSYLLQLKAPDWWGFHFGFELLIVNGALCFLGMLLIRKR